MADILKKVTWTLIVHNRRDNYNKRNYLAMVRTNAVLAQRLNTRMHHKYILPSSSSLSGACNTLTEQSYVKIDDTSSNRKDCVELSNV